NLAVKLLRLLRVPGHVFEPHEFARACLAIRRLRFRFLLGSHGRFPFCSETCDPYRPAYAFSRPAMSSFFIWSIASMVRFERAGSLSFIISPSTVGTICHETP